MAAGFKVGDIVKLKSGGPKMTVVTVGDLHGEPHVWCTWFAEGKRANADFPPDALVSAPSVETEGL